MDLMVSKTHVHVILILKKVERLVPFSFRHVVRIFMHAAFLVDFYGNATYLESKEKSNLVTCTNVIVHIVNRRK